MVRAAFTLAAAAGMLAAQGQPPAPKPLEFKAESPKFWEIFNQGSTIEKIATGFGFLEGPVWDEQGFLYVRDEVQNKVSRVYPDGRVETVLSIGDPDGSTLVRGGHLITCASVL